MELVQFVLLTVIPFVLVLSVVVFVHEFGHFQAARWCKIAIDTFSIGFGKRLIGWTDRQGVQWKVGALPLGGYVKFLDDADPASTKPVAADYSDPAQLEADRRKGLFHAQPVGARAFVVAAGPLTNFIFAIVAFAAIGMIVGRDVTRYEELPVRVGQAEAGTPSAEAGLQKGDVIRQIDGRPITRFEDLVQIVGASENKPLAFSIERGGQMVTLTVTPRKITHAGQSAVRIGAPRMVLDSERTIVPLGPVEAVGHGVTQTWRIIALHGEFFAKLASPNPPTDQLSGPIGILNETGKVAQAAVSGDKTLVQQAGDLGLMLLGWAALLSVAVGIVNLLPIPILDGGHLVFYAIEAIRGKRLSDKAQEWSFKAGLVVLLSLFVFATWNDLSRILPNLLRF